MKVVAFFGVLIIGYFIGSIPFGLVLVKLKTGKDIRTIQSGRTGGTNAMRAGGFWVGLSTALLDGLKGVAGVVIAITMLPDVTWAHVLSPIMVILGHNYSIFLAEKDENGKIRLRGGAGGAPCVGGSVGLWWPNLFILPLLGASVLFGVGYASVATLSVAILSSIIFAFLAATQGFPWEYVVYGLLAEILLIISLIPNIRRLFNGTERLVGWRARKMKAKQQEG